MSSHTGQSMSTILHERGSHLCYPLRGHSVAYVSLLPHAYMVLHSAGRGRLLSEVTISESDDVQSRRLGIWGVLCRLDSPSIGRWLRISSGTLLVVSPALFAGSVHMDLSHLTFLLKGRGLRLCVTCTTKFFVAGDGGVSWCRLQVRSLLVLHFQDLC